MQCFRCQSSAVLFQRYSGRSLCARHLCADIESRAKRVIRQNRWLVSGDRIGVVSGIAHSDALQIFLGRLLADRNDIALDRVTPAPGLRAGTSAWYKTLFETARDGGFTRIALPFCADDLAAEILSSLFRGDVSALLTPGVEGPDVRIMQPLQEIAADELVFYAEYAQGAGSVCEPCTDTGFHDPFDEDIRNFLGAFSSRHPSAPHALRRYREHLRDLARD